jgi:hypothetical protein
MAEQQRFEFDEVDIANLAAAILAGLTDKDASIEVKSAALKSAAAVIDNAIAAKMMSAAYFNALNPKR